MKLYCQRCDFTASIDISAKEVPFEISKHGMLHGNEFLPYPESTDDLLQLQRWEQISEVAKHLPSAESLMTPRERALLTPPQGDGKK